MPTNTCKCLKDGVFQDIPSAPFYVLSIDTYMSGWGLCEGKTNVCVVPCDDMATAERVRKFIYPRKEQRGIRIVKGDYNFDQKSNVLDPEILYSLVTDWIAEANEMFPEE